MPESLLGTLAFLTHRTARHRLPHIFAIRANGISPLHRMSFASIAYTQLDLEGVFDMVEGDELPPGVEDHAYGVETDAAREALMAAAAESEPLSGHQP